MEQKRTKRNKKYLYESLSHKEQDAVSLALEGWRYDEITTEIKVSYGTVRKWFMVSGKCKQAYDELKQEQTKLNNHLLKVGGIDIRLEVG